jgi:predicted small metal-binding protein
MGKVINCECGQVVRGKTEDELVANVEEHVRTDHPQLVGKMSRKDILPRWPKRITHRRLARGRPDSPLDVGPSLGQYAYVSLSNTARVYVVELRAGKILQRIVSSFAWWPWRSSSADR